MLFKYKSILISVLVLANISAGAKTSLENFLPLVRNGELVKHTHYYISYDEAHEQAEWTSHRLTRDMLRGRQKRTNDFRADPKVRTGTVSGSGYKGSGYQRGHLVPAANMKMDCRSMSETFYMSNMTPMIGDFNEGIWAKLEMQVRKWAKSEGEVFVVSGPILTNDLKRIKSGVSVAKFFFKVVLDYSGHEKKMIAFLFSHRGSRKSLSHYQISVNELERITGHDFFPAIPDELEEKLESEFNQSWWFQKEQSFNQYSEDRFEDEDMLGFLGLQGKYPQNDPKSKCQ